nr:hypothetical protein [Bacteroidota bacterium]
QNLSDQSQTFRLNILSEISWIDMFGNHADYDEKDQLMAMKPFEYLWIKL